MEAAEIHRQRAQSVHDKYMSHTCYTFARKADRHRSHPQQPWQTPDKKTRLCQRTGCPGKPYLELPPPSLHLSSIHKILKDTASEAASRLLATETTTEHSRQGKPATLKCEVTTSDVVTSHLSVAGFPPHHKDSLHFELAARRLLPRV